MTATYMGVFSETTQTLDKVLQELSIVFDEVGVIFAGSITRLESNFGVDLSFYIEEGFDLEKGQEINSLDDVLWVASDWDGFNILCLWKFILDVTDNSIASEVSFSFAKSSTGWRISFNETAAANSLRREDESFEAHLYRFLLSICRRLRMSACVYGDDTSLENLYPDSNILSDVLRTGLLPSGAIVHCVVFSTSEFSLQDAQVWAASYGREVVESTSGYGILKLLPLDDMD